MKYFLATIILCFAINNRADVSSFKMKLTVKSFKGSDATYTLDNQTNDIVVTTNLENWKCNLKNNKAGSKKMKDTILSYIKCSAGDNSMEYSFSCRPNELRYESFELMDKKIRQVLFLNAFKSSINLTPIIYKIPSIQLSPWGETLLFGPRLLFNTE